MDTLSKWPSTLLIPDLSFSFRGGGHPKRDEGEECEVFRHHVYQVFPHTQHRCPKGGHGHRSASARHGVHIRAGQAHQQPLLTTGYCLPGEVSGSNSCPFSRLKRFGQVLNCSDKIPMLPEDQMGPLFISYMKIELLSFVFGLNCKFY